MSQSLKFKVVIPARYASTRLPGKPLADIAGKPMVQHVYEKAQASGASDLVVATDDDRVKNAVQSFGGKVLMTSPQCPTGTDRLTEVVKTLGWGPEEIVVNVQGDEPLIPPALIRMTAQALADNPACGISTVASPIHSGGDLSNPNIVKVVLRKDQRALYFSRLPIPHLRDPSHQEAQELWAQAYWRHIGIYGYRAGTLLQFSQWEPCLLERMESLEQLRALFHGVDIFVSRIPEAPPHGVDTPEDLEKVRAQF